MAPSKYRFAPYDPDWPRRFEREAARLRELLGAGLVAVHHVGSTAVPGLAAKPIIDLLPVVATLGVVADGTARLEARGYRTWGAYGLPGRRFFTRDADGYRTHNIHFYALDNPDIHRHLVFRDYLRSFEQVRDRYAAVKRAAYAAHPDDIGAYNDAKDGWIRQATRAAMAWWEAA